MKMLKAERSEVWLADLGLAAKARPVLVVSIPFLGNWHFKLPPNGEDRSRQSSVVGHRLVKKQIMGIPSIFEFRRAIDRLKLAATLVLGVSTIVHQADAAESGPGPGVAEIYNLLRANLPNARPEEMDRAAIQGILQKYSGQASLITNVVEAYTPETGSVGRTNLIDGAFAYIRMDRIGKELPDLVKAAYENLSQDRK